MSNNSASEAKALGTLQIGLLLLLLTYKKFY